MHFLSHILGITRTSYHFIVIFNITDLIWNKIATLVSMIITEHEKENKRDILRDFGQYILKYRQKIRKHYISYAIYLAWYNINAYIKNYINQKVQIYVHISQFYKLKQKHYLFSYYNFYA